MTKAPFDFATIDTVAACDKPFALELKHPATKAGLGCGVMIVGKDSAIFREHVRKSANEKLRKNAVNNRRGKEAETPTIEKIEEDAIDLLVACTTGFFGEIVIDGDAQSFSPENVRKFYARFPDVRAQVDEAIGDVENFIKA